MLTISSMALIDLSNLLDNLGLKTEIEDGCVEFDGGYATAVMGDNTTVRVVLDSGSEAYAVRPLEAKEFILTNK